MIWALLWKEWREYRWLLLGCTAVWVVLAVATFWWDVMRYNSEGGAVGRNNLDVFVIIYLPSLLLPAFAAGQVMARERADNLLATLPVRRVWIAAVKVVAGTLFLVVPLLAARQSMLSLFPREIGHPYHDPYRLDWDFQMIILSALMLFFWTLILGARWRSRGVAAIISVAILFGGIICYYFTFTLRESVEFQFDKLPYVVLVALNPISAFGGLGYHQHNGFSISDAIAIARPSFAVVLALTAILRLSPMHFRVSRSDIRTATAREIVRPSWFRSQGIMLLWKTMREIQWFAFWAIVLNYLVALTVMGILLLRNGNLAFQLKPAIAFTWILAGVIWFVIGAILMIALGVRITSGDRQGGLENFWRSRPVPPVTFFWIKYCAGALVPLIVGAMLWAGYIMTSEDTGFDHYILWLYMVRDACCVQLLIYSITVLVVTVTRHSFTAATMACGMAVVALLFEFMFFSKLHDGGWDKFIFLMVPGAVGLAVIASFFWRHAEGSGGLRGTLKVWTKSDPIVPAAQ